MKSEGRSKRWPLLSKEHLSRLNHLSRVTYLEVKYASLCAELRNKEISREFFDKQIKQVLTLLGDGKFLSAGPTNDFSPYVKGELQNIAQAWRRIADREHGIEMENDNE